MRADSPGSGVRPPQGREIGRSGLKASALALGGTAIGNVFRAVSDEQAQETVRVALAGGVRLFDVAPVYGFGLAERRLGAALRGVPRDDFIVSTKVGYRLEPLPPGAPRSQVWIDAPPMGTRFDFSYDFALRSIEESLERLGLDRVDLVAIHDPDEALGFQPPSGKDPDQLFREVMDGTYRALDTLRSQRVIAGIGVGINDWPLLMRYVHAGAFDFFMVAGRYTLLDQETLDPFLPACLERGTSLLAGGPLNSGILSSGAAGGATYHYAPPPPEILNRVHGIEAACRDFGISLRAAALQFPLRHPAVAAVVPGARTAAQAQDNIDAMREAIPEDFWTRLKEDGLIDRRAP